MATNVANLSALLEHARSEERAGRLDAALESYLQALDLTPAEDFAERSSLLRWIGTVHRKRGDLDHATESYLASEKIAAENNDVVNVASALNCLAIVAQQRASIEEAIQLYSQARDLVSATSDERLAAMIDQNLGTLANMRGDTQAAISSYWSALKRFRALGDEVAMVWSLNNLGMAYIDRGEWTVAASCFDDAFEVADRLRDADLLGTIELNRADLFLKSGSLTRARESCDHAFEIFSRIDSRSSLGEAFKFYGILYREMNRPGLAATHFEQAVSLAEATEDRLLEAEAQAEWSLLELARGDNRAALHRLNRSHSLFTQLHADADLHDLDVRLDRLEDRYMHVMQRWAESIESKDNYTAGHCERVADYACMLAEASGISGRDLTWFRMGAYLHDVGKTAVPIEVLNKPGKLTHEEFEQMKSHTVVGDQIVSELDFPWDVRPLVRNHHERWDGTGYPDRLSGEDIPLHARILCVADVYDALTTARSYRPALPQEEALRIMRRDAGKLLDPRLFDEFEKLIRARGRGRGA